MTEQAKKKHTQIREDILATKEMLTKRLSEVDKQKIHQYLDSMIQNIVDIKGDNTTISCEKNNK